MQHNPQLEDPFDPLNQSQVSTAAKQERVETKGDNDVSHMLEGIHDTWMTSGPRVSWHKRAGRLR